MKGGLAGQPGRDELAVRPQLVAALYGSRLGLVATAARSAHPGRPPAARAAAMARSAAGGLAEFRRWAASHCEVAELLGARMGLTEQVQVALGHLYERWDGKGLPGDLRGEQVPLPVRVMQVAQDADIAWQRGGPGTAAPCASRTDLSAAHRSTVLRSSASDSA